MGLSKLYLSETSLLFLASSHPDRQRLIAILEDWLRQEGQILTSTLALDRLQQLLGQQGIALPRLRHLWGIMDGLFHSILPLEWTMLKSALDIQEEQGFCYTKALHLALVRAHDISHIIAGHQSLPVEENIFQIQF